jgi:hypothetical protein
MRFRSALTIAALVLAASPLTAQLPTTNQNGVSVMFNTTGASLGNPIARTFGSMASVYTGKNKLTFTGLTGTPTLDILCVDLFNGISNGTLYSADITFLSSGTAALASRTRAGELLGGSTAMQRYMRAAWLSEQFQTTNRGTNASTSQWDDLHGAVWFMMNGVGPVVDSGISFWLTQVAAAELGGFAGMDFSKYAIVTDVRMNEHGVGGVQEFMIRTSVVPEPSTYALMATGLMAMAGMARRRRMALAR